MCATTDATLIIKKRASPDASESDFSFVFAVIYSAGMINQVQRQCIKAQERQDKKIMGIVLGDNTLVLRLLTSGPGNARPLLISYPLHLGEPVHGAFIALSWRPNEQTSHMAEVEAYPLHAYTIVWRTRRLA